MRKRLGNLTGRLLRLTIDNMPRGRKRSTLAQLESQLAKLDAARLKIVASLRARVDTITGGAAKGARAMIQNVEQTVDVAAPRRSKVSAAGRAKLRAAAKRRWAEAKKAGKTRLG